MPAGAPSTIAAISVVASCIVGSFSTQACDAADFPPTVDECDHELAADIAELHVSLLQRKTGFPQDLSDDHTADAVAVRVLDDDDDKANILASINDKLRTEMQPKLNEQIPATIKERGMDPLTGDHGPSDSKGKVKEITGLSSLRVKSFEATDMDISDTGVVVSFLMKMGMNSPLTGSLDMKGMPAVFKFAGISMEMAIDGNLNILEDQTQIDTLDVVNTAFDWQTSELSCQGSGFKAKLCNRFGSVLLEKKKPSIAAKIAAKMKDSLQTKFSEMVPIPIERK